MARKRVQQKGTSESQRARKGRRPARMVFSRKNYILLITGIAVVAFGYVIMRIDNQVEGVVSLYIAPLLILGGYLEIIYAIFHRPKEDTRAE